MSLLRQLRTKKERLRPHVARRLARAVWAELILAGLPEKEHDIVNTGYSFDVINKFTGEVAASVFHDATAEDRQIQ